MKRRTAVHASPAARRAAETLFAPQTPPAAPGYWMHETSGVLRPAVEAYLAGRPLSPLAIAALRAYFRQWIGARVWDANPHASPEERAQLAALRRRVDDLTSRAAIEAWLDDLAAAGLDPL